MKSKRKFTVNAEQKSIRTWTYSVEAISKKEAIDMVINGEVDKMMMKKPTRLVIYDMLDLWMMKNSFVI